VGDDGGRESGVVERGKDKRRLLVAEYRLGAWGSGGVERGEN